MNYFNCHTDSPAQQCHKLLKIAAPSAIPVLIQGETGSGKEVAARSLHHWGANPTAPFVALNCGAINPSLLESTLFGAVKGAFTGAQQDQIGLVRAAHGGTLFLDEIGELPLEAQSRLLRTLQEKTVLPVGAHQEIPVNFRLICATHRDLRQLQQQGLFREDLLYRISVFPIRIPPLRERTVDIPLLAEQIWSQQAPDNPTLASTLSPAEMDHLLKFTWPGNVRQLRNVLERWHLLRHHEMSFFEALQGELHQDHYTNPSGVKYQAPRLTPSPQSIRRALQKHRNNQSQTARFLGISRGSLSYQLKKHSIST